MSRILLWAVNYAPEPIGIAPLVTDACEWLAARGHDVEVVTAVPNYPERQIRSGYARHEERAGVHLTRTWLRTRPGETFLDKALYELSFAATSSPAALRSLGRADVLVCVVPTLLSTAAAAATVSALRMVRRAPRFVVWMQDLVLVGARAVGPFSPASRALLAAAQRIEGRTVAAADRVVVCSPGFADYLAERGVRKTRIETIPNWVDVDAIRPQARGRANGVTRFLYAGNLGYSQGFETLVAAARSLAGLVEVEIVGDGNAAAHTRRIAEQAPNITVRPPVPAAEFPALLGRADVHVVVQRAVSAGANLPSKIGPYLASGRPIVASIQPGTPAAELLAASGGAVVVPPERPEELARAMERLAANAAERDELGRAGRAYAETALAREAVLARLEAAILGR